MVNRISTHINYINWFIIRNIGIFSRGIFSLKKRTYIIIALLSLAFLVNFSDSSSVFYDFTVLDYTYDIVESDWDIQYGLLSASATGIFFGENTYPVGSQYDLHVIAEHPFSVDYEMSMGSDTVEKTDTNSSGPLIYQFNLFSYLDGFFIPWNQTALELGPPKLFSTHFFDLEEYAEFFRSDIDYRHVSYQTGHGLWLGGQSMAYYSEKNSIGFLDIHRRVESYEGHPYDTYINEGEHHFKIEFNLVTGVLNGYHILLESTGFFNNISFDFSFHQQIELEGYNMAKFVNMGLPGYNFLIAIPVLLAIYSIRIYIKKNRKKEALTN